MFIPPNQTIEITPQQMFQSSSDHLRKKDQNLTNHITIVIYTKEPLFLGDGMRLHINVILIMYVKN